MTTIIIDDKSVGAKEMIEFLKTQRFARIINEKEPNAETKRAILDVQKGKVTRCSGAEDMMNKLNA
jgi:hypothetical protein